MKKPAVVMVVTVVLMAGLLTSLFLLRSLDDNRLTSWNWVFNNWSLADFILKLSISLAAACLLAGLNIPEKIRKPLVFGVLGLTAALFWQEPEVLVDAGRYFTYAKYLELYGAGYYWREWGAAIKVWTDLPAIPFFYGLIFRYLGEQRILIQVFNTLLFASTGVLAYAIAKGLRPRENGWTAGILMLGFPYLFTQVPLMLVDVPVMFLITLCVYALQRAAREGGAHHTALASAAVALAFFAKFSAWPLLLAMFGAALLAPADNPATRSRTLSVLGLSAALVVPGLLLKRHLIGDQIRLLLDYQWSGLNRWSESPLSTFLFQIHPLVSLFACGGALRALKRRDSSCTVITAVAGAALLLGLGRSRYLVPVFPMLALLAAYGVGGLQHAPFRRILVLGVALTALMPAVLAYRPFLQKLSAVNLMKAGAYLDSLPDGVVEVAAPAPPDNHYNPAVFIPLLDLFTRRDICRNAGPAVEPPPAGQIAESSLRFTWEYVLPPYYLCPEGQSRSASALVLISATPPAANPPWENPSAGDCTGRFDAQTGIFRLKTLVQVCQIRR